MVTDHLQPLSRETYPLPYGALVSNEAAEASPRYERRRQAIVQAAIRVLAREGVKGMRLGDVAAQLGLTTNSVSYYYRRKEDLAVACFEAGLETMHRMVDEAATMASPADRVRRFIRCYLEAHGRTRLGQQPPVSIFSDLRALNEPLRSRVCADYLAMHRKAVGLFEAPELGWIGEVGRHVRAHILLEQCYWAEIWLRRYSWDDLPRVHARLSDILLNGLAAKGREWTPKPLDAVAPSAGDLSPQQNFLRSATRLINARGYRGASVSEISEALNVTKGSFYHHHDAKDDLVIACFHETYRTMRRVQRAVREVAGNEWQKLSTATASLVRHQFLPEGPLLRTAALASIPTELRDRVTSMSRRVAEHFAAIISDGIAEGTVRSIDPLIAAEAITCMINSAADFPFFFRGIHAQTAPDLYARPLLLGFLTP